MHALNCTHMNNPLYFSSSTHLLKLSFKDFPQNPFLNTFQKLCCAQCNLRLIIRELYCFSQRWSWCSVLQGKQLTYILIYLFYNALLAPIKSLKISNLAALTRYPERKDVEIFPNKHGMPKRAQLGTFWTREKLGRVSSWAKFKTGCWSLSPAYFTMKWNSLPHWVRIRFVPADSDELSNRIRFCVNVTVLFQQYKEGNFKVLNYQTIYNIIPIYVRWGFGS